MFDGTTVSMPDTPENQAAYPQVYNQKPGLGFPIARIGVITSLACGAILNLGFCRYAGKGQGEVSLLRQLWDVLRPGDVLLADSLLSNWTGIVLLKERGVDLVSRLNKAHRKADFRRGKRLGHDDHIVRWHKPTSIRSVDRRTYNSLPEYVTIREARIRVEQPGFRTKAIVVVTTLLDPQETTKEDLATLYRARWNNEVYQPECTPSALLYQLRSLEIKVSAKALLQLANWCRQQHAASKPSTFLPEQGGSICNLKFPPAPNDRFTRIGDHNSIGTTLEAVAADQAARTGCTANADSRSAADSSHREGGVR